VRTHRNAVRTLAALALAVTLTGCQSLRDGNPSDPAPDDDVTPGAPADADAPLLQLDLSGGFVPIGYDFAVVPQLTIYPDGRAITHGPQILIYPGPALPNLQVVQLSDADVEALIDAARTAGLLGEAPDYGQPPIADAPTMFVTLVVNGQRYDHAVESYGMTEGLEGADDGGMGLSEDERAARVAMAGFIERAQELVGSAGGEEPYVIEAFAFFALPAAESGDQEGELERQVLPWPLDLALADAAECTVASGADAQTLLETLADANTATQFEQDGAVYDVFFRPLLPHEDGCDGLG